MSACDACLRRSHLIAFLAARVAAVLAEPRPRPSAILGLPEEDFIAAVAGPRKEAAERYLEDFEPDVARNVAERAEIGELCSHDALYPERLRDLYDPPAVLYHTGSAARLAELAELPTVTVVGARRASPAGIAMAHELGRGATSAGITVVSGLALGIDGAAHRGALDAGGAPLAVLAGGADIPYPRSHVRLYEQVRKRGTVVSELPPGVRPLRWSFPARNRIMAALGRVTVVVEARDPSGSLITADFATQLNRGLAVVPGPATSPFADGCLKLLREGAASVVRGVSDLVDDVYDGEGRPEGWDPSGRAYAVERLSDFDRAVLDAVEEGQQAGGIAREHSISAGRVRAALARLEMAGLIVPDGRGAYQPSPAR
jgi:DNA processing protein